MFCYWSCSTFYLGFRPFSPDLHFFFRVGLVFCRACVIFLASGLDDFVPIVICLRQWLFVPKTMAARPLMEGTAEPRRIAIFVPCWKESAVIGNMVRHNLAAIRYNNYDFFLGTYPNDEPTVKEAKQLAEYFPNVHVAICDKPGPLLKRTVSTPSSAAWSSMKPKPTFASTPSSCTMPKT